MSTVSHGEGADRKRRAGTREVTGPFGRKKHRSSHHGDLISRPPIALGREVVAIEVGDSQSENSRFTVHKSLLTALFWQTALKKCWKEGQDNKVKLPKVEPEVFERFYQWLYGFEPGSLPVQPSVAFDLLTDSYLFAELYGEEEYTAHVMNEIHKLCGLRGRIPTDMICKVFCATSESSILREYVLLFCKLVSEPEIFDGINCVDFLRACCKHTVAGERPEREDCVGKSTTESFLSCRPLQDLIFKINLVDRTVTGS